MKSRIDPNIQGSLYLMDAPYEKVHTLTDYYDGPRGGVADFNGEPVAYESEFADIGGTDPDTFLLQPISEQAFAHAMEDWQIWLRWDKAFKAGQASEDTHPALPEDRARHEELAPLLEDELRIEEASAMRAKADFIVIDGQSLVKWEIIGNEEK